MDIIKGYGKGTHKSPGAKWWCDLWYQVSEGQKLDMLIRIDNFPISLGMEKAVRKEHTVLTMSRQDKGGRPNEPKL